MSNKPDISDFVRKIDAVLDTCKKLPDEIAAIAVDFSKERFREQAWLDGTKQKWKPRKQPRGKAGSKRSQTLLVDTARLKRSIRKIKATPEQVAIGTDVPYAEIHNEGGTVNKTVGVKSHVIKSHRRKAHNRQRKGRSERIGAQTVKAYSVRAHTRKMNLKIPSRRFIGSSHTLARRIELHVTARFIRALK